MKSRNWNRPLPEKFLMGGERRFSSELTQLNKGWVLRRTSDFPSFHAVEQLEEIPGAEFRFFPRFRDLSQPQVNSHEFDRIPILDSFSWDWIEFRFSPLQDIRVNTIYWSPDSQVICGESWISNPTELKRIVLLDLVCLLQSQGAGNQITHQKIKGRSVLTGDIDDQNILLFMAGNPDFREDPFPILQNKLTLLPLGEEKINWICIKSDSTEIGMEILEKVLHLDWAGEISRRKVSLQSQIEITTGDPEWDFVLALSQKQAQLIYHQISAPNDPKTPTSEEITTIQALMLLQSIDNLTPEIAKNILDLVFKQDLQPDDEVKDIKQGSTPPILAAELLWQVQQMGFSSEIWSPYIEQTLKWLAAWFSPRMDKDGDGIPELINPWILDLSGAEQLSENRLLPYPHLESPGLGAILFNDLCKIEILHQIFGKDPDLQIQNRKENLRIFLKDSWISDDDEFQNRDSQSHKFVKGFNIAESLEPGLNILKVELPQPARIGVLKHRISSEHTLGDISLICHGQDWCGNYRIEEFHAKDFYWGKGFDWAISESIFSKIDYCILNGITQKCQISLITPPTSSGDITLTLPLWAGALSDDHSVEIIKKMLLDPDRYWSHFGFISTPGTEEAVMTLFWNLLLGQSLLKLGRYETVTELITRWMDVIIPTLEKTGSFHSNYGVKTGQEFGLKGNMESLFPVRFFLHALGIEILHDDKLIISGNNPTPWPVSVKYRGYTIKREKDNTIIMRPGKEKLSLKDLDTYQLDLI